VTPLVFSDASDADDVELITPEELAELWKVQTSWIYKATKWKKDPLPHVKLGKYMSLKNMFDIIPGSRYGWPKNVLHWAGIRESILDICATVRPHFFIADGIVAMEGDGPLNGTPKCLNTILLADDAVSADAALIRLLGLNIDAINHVWEAGKFIGNATHGFRDWTEKGRESA
jgi:hypothetical protein